MKSYFTRFLHHIMSHSGIREVFTSSLSLSDLIGESRLNQVANLSHLDYRVKPDNDGFCTGRSMAEMLGVLAIIGVLSVGTIAGYGKAMFKYKLNKQTEQINQLIGTIVRYKSSLMINSVSADAPASDYQLVPILKKLGEIPKEMYTSDNIFIKDAFGTEYYIYQRNWYNYITLRTGDLDRNESSFQVCKNLYLIAKEWHKEILVINTVAYKGNEYADQGCHLGDDTQSIITCNKRIKDLQLTDLDDICRAATDEGHYSLAIDI